MAVGRWYAVLLFLSFFVRFNFRFDQLFDVAVNCYFIFLGGALAYTVCPQKSKPNVFFDVT